jgi:hypothetical protein
MTPAAHDRSDPISASPCVLFLVAIVLLAVVTPVVPALAGTRNRTQSKNKKATHPATRPILPERHATSASKSRVVPQPLPARSKKTSQPHRSRLAMRGQVHSSATQRSASPPGSTINSAPVSSPRPVFTMTPTSPSSQPSTTADDRLTQAAQIQASAMAALNVMDHTLPGAPLPTLASRLQSVGYGYFWAGENIACNAPDAASVETLWMNSPPHRANILSPVPTSIGVAVAYSSQGEPYYCQVFGQANP